MSMTRRSVLAAGSVFAASTPFGGSALAQTQPSNPAQGTSPRNQGRQAPGFYRFKVGDIEITAIHDGFALRPIEGLIRNAELAQVQQAMQEAFLPPTQLPITFTGLVINNGGRLAIIDTGNGEFGAPTSGQWLTNFRAAGFDPAQVNTVIISHFHGDHINGLRRKDGSAVFPNAEVMVPAAEWAFWMDEGQMSRAPEGMRGAFQNVHRAFDPIVKDVKQYEPGKEIVPGVTTVAAAGHTPGHTAYVIASGNAKLMMVSDITNHPALFVRNPDWAVVFDMDAEQARQTRRRILDMAAAERTQVSFYHAPFPATGFITKEGDKFRLVPVQWSSAL